MKPESQVYRLSHRFPGVWCLADVLPACVDGVYHIGANHGLHQLLAQPQMLARRQARRWGKRACGMAPCGFKAVFRAQPAAQRGGGFGRICAADGAIENACFMRL